MINVLAARIGNKVSSGLQQTWSELLAELDCSPYK